MCSILNTESQDDDHHSSSRYQLAQLRFKYQHRGSPHVHSVAWLEDAPDVEKVLSSAVEDPSIVQDLIRYIDKTVTTKNPAAVLPDGSNVSDAPLPKTNPHVCNKPYSEVEDHYQDLNDLIATCQRHTIY